MLFNEPKLLKLTRATAVNSSARVSVLFNEPKLLKLLSSTEFTGLGGRTVSVLFNEPKLLKYSRPDLWEYEFIPFQCSSTSRNC